MRKTRSLARALAGPTGHSPYGIFFGNEFQRENEKKINLENKERPNEHVYGPFAIKMLVACNKPDIREEKLSAKKIFSAKQ